jgi:hypothetical protein
MTISPLSAEALLRSWEEGESEGSGSRRAVRLLAFAHPQRTREELAKLSVGRRDELLLELREQYLGRTLRVCGECPACQEPVETVFDIHDLPRAGAAKSDAPLYQMNHEGIDIRFRLPDSMDLEAAGRCGDVQSARNLLLDRCVVEATDGEPSRRPGSALSAEIQEAVEAEMDRLDPLAVVQLDLECPGCSSRWQARLDLAEIVWSEFADMARRLLGEISTLARHYHWSEHSILAMSARRRRTYLELAGA